MASRIVVAVALFAVCHSSPVLNNVREKRFTKIVQANSQGYGGEVKSSASSDLKSVQGFGSYNDHGNAAHDALGQAYPSKTEVKIVESDTPSIEARYQPAYYPAAPPSVVTYSQNFGAPVEPASSGIAQSSANVGSGGAVSNARAQINEPTNIGGQYQGYNTYYPGYGSASSNAGAQYGSATSSARVGPVPTRKSISWHFGTAYDQPAAYVRSAPSGSVNTNVRTVGAAQSFANANPNSASSHTKSSGGNAQSAAVVNNPSYYNLRSGEIEAPGSSDIRTLANSSGIGSASSTADQTHAKSYANSERDGSANSYAYTHPNNAPTFRAQELSTNFNVNSRSEGWGSAAANAYSN